MTAALVAQPSFSRDVSLSVIDMLGRAVTLPRPPRRIVLLEGRDILTMALFQPRPAELVVGWAAADRFDSDLLRDGFERSAGHPIAVVGKQAADTLSLEGILSLAPDLVVATAFMAPGGDPQAAIDRLAQFGIPLVFSDAASNAAVETGNRGSPRQGLAALLRMWGALLGEPTRSEEIIAFVEKRFEVVSRRLTGAPKVKTFLEIMSLYDECCWAAGTRIWGELLGDAGGRSLDGLNAPWTAKLSTEQLLAQQPQVYIATGGGYASMTRPAIGPGLDAHAGRRGLQRLTERIGFASLPAVRDRRVHGIWTGLITVPVLNIVFVELAAKWLHPEACRDLDPAGTLAEINRRFLSQPLPGPLWANLDGTDP
ncbi:ABC transporter substrate-binding protein [Bosea sp. ASV33]|uniref:ABC transporter substrate-binding protein n=1 Tax=Bosea sp. ASV33 TaxID=2795106 RepID=UPI0020BF569E|nr:ABC transporter substrate-binding protein [Bosea sp. ASV33]